MNAENSQAVGAPVEPTVRPAAWIDASSLRWLKAKPETRSCRTEIFGVQQEGQLPLYDQAALDAAVAAERDCRTCAHHTYASGGCVSALRCVGGDRYQPTQPRQLWEQRPHKPAPF